MKNIEFNAIDKNIRDCLAQAFVVDKKFVKNARSTYGTSLDKNTTSSIFTSIDQDDCLILFNNLLRSSSQDMSEQNDNDSQILVRSYVSKVIVYGDNSSAASNSAIARLRSGAIRTKMYDLGIHLESISESTSMTEFKNEAVWERCDFEINFACEHMIEDIVEEYYANSIGEMNYIEAE